MKKANKIQRTFQRIHGIMERYCQQTYSKPKLGRPFVYQPSWILSLVLLQRLLAIKQETTFLKMLRFLLHLPASEIPTQSTYNKRVRSFAHQESDFINWLREIQPWWAHTVHLLIDAFPIEAKHSMRRFHKKKCGWASVGYCASKKQYYFGYKVLLICTKHGFPVQWMIYPAHRHEILLTHNLLLGQRNKFIIGDKGFTSTEIFEKLYHENGIHLFYPPKKNSTESILSSKGKKWMGERKQIENLISVLERMGLGKPGGKSDFGNIARINSGICAIAVMQVLKIWNKEILDIEGILLN